MKNRKILMPYPSAALPLPPRRWRNARLCVLGVLLLGWIVLWVVVPRELFPQPCSSLLYDRNGELLGGRIAADGQWRFPMGDCVPEKFVQCLVAYEDKRFFRHPGIDPLAVDNALENRALNGIADTDFPVAQGSIDAVHARYDVVLANILARPLTEMAPDIVRACAAGGCLVLSGLLEIQADGVEQAYRACGLPAARRLVDGEWCALIWDEVPR